MITAKLFTRDGRLVAEFVMPPFKLLPELAVWGSRYFCRLDPFGEPTKPEYYEVCAWSVDASAALTAGSQS